MECHGIILPTATLKDRQYAVERAMAWVDEQQRLADHAGEYIEVVFNRRLAIDWTFSRFNSEVDPTSSRARAYLPEPAQPRVRLGNTPERGQVVASVSPILLDYDDTQFNSTRQPAVFVMESSCHHVAGRMSPSFTRWDAEKHVYPVPVRTYTFD